MFLVSKVLFFSTLFAFTSPFFLSVSNMEKSAKISSPSELKASLGTISLVGSGPGDPKLLTLQAVELIKNASLVISDRLVSSEILNLVECELKIARKYPGCAEDAQEEIYDWVREAINSGRNVVRLKIGDPFLFGRGAEEVLEFRKLGIEPFVSPGISSSYCAPLSASIPLTHRGVSNQVIIGTGYGRDSSVTDIPPYSPECTVVLLMAVGRIQSISENMMTMGYPEDTPVAIVERATTPTERVSTGTLKDIAEVAVSNKVSAPATIIIGHVVNVLR